MEVLLIWKLISLHTTVFLISAALLRCQGLPATGGTTLHYVQMILNHGVASPEVLFKNDPNNVQWKMEPGQLLELGKLESFKLGQWFQHRYSTPNGGWIVGENIHIRTTDTDRTRDTASYFVAGLVSPQNAAVESIILKNIQQLPIQVLPKNNDPFTDVYILDNCKRMQQFMDILRMTPEEKRVVEENKDLGEIMFNESGKRLENPIEFLNACNTLNVEKAIGLQLPEWIRQDEEQIFRLREYFSFKYIKMPEITQLTGGYLIREIMHRMLDVMSANTSSDLQSYVYVAHDYTLMYIMSAMRLYNYVLPPYSSALILELHENVEGSYFLQVLYKNETQREPYVLNFPLCADLCPWQQALLATGCYFVEDLSAACVPMNQEETLRKQHEFDQWFP